MKNLAVILFLFVANCGLSFAFQRTRLDDGWRFQSGDDRLWAAANYDDSQWRKLDLPHDWSIEGEFDPQAPAGGNGAYLPTGTGWYRLKLKSERVKELKRSCQVRLYFEGVYMNSTVFLNGDSIGGHPYGFSGFWIDVTDKLHEDVNTLAVRVDNSAQKNCRWYTGSGIYRHVWLYEMDPTTTDDPWQLYVHTEQICGINADGSKADSAIVHITYPGRLDERRTYRDIKLWSPEHPVLYPIEAGGITLDYGFRQISFSPEGMLLNGHPYTLNGGNVHSDNGVLGAASLDDAEWRKARLVKEAGFNAVRTAHNTPSEEFIRACDHLGLLVIEEPFDGLRAKKNKHDYHELFDHWWQEDVEALIRRDRNHPSVIAWSSGNELFERRKIEAITTTQKMARLMRQLDPSRPVTQALCEVKPIFDPLAEQLDLVGYNYLIDQAEKDHRRCPERIIYQSESYPDSAFQSWAAVAEHPYVIGDFVWSAIDYLGESGIGRAHYAADTADPGEHWQGEKFPWHGASCGYMDLTGRRKPISYYRQMLWDSIPHIYIHVREPDGYNDSITCTRWSTWPASQSWNWPGHEGKPIEVEVYSNYHKVALFLNDSLVGTRPTTRAERHKARFALPYQPGTLRAVGILEDGSKSNQVECVTAGTPVTLRLTPDKTILSADGQNLSYVVIEMVDAKGQLVPNADANLNISLSGPATLLAVGNGNMQDTDPYAAHVAQGTNQTTHQLWQGRAIAVIRSGHKAGKLQLSVSAGKINSSIKLKTK